MIEVHVAGDRLDDDRRRSRSPSAANARLDRGEVVVRQHDRLVGDRRRHAGRGRLAERQRARARLHQQAVAVAVIAAFELHDLRCARCSRARAAAPTSSPRCPTTRAAPARATAGGGTSVSAISISISVGAPNDKPVRRALPAPRARPPDARGRGSPGPRSRRSRCSACRRRPTRTAPSPRAKKRGVPPTERKARTGELTPAGIVRCARANSSSLRLMAVASGSMAIEAGARAPRRRA